MSVGRRVGIGAVIVLAGGAALALMTAFGVPFAFGLAWVLLLGALVVLSRQVLLDDDGAWPPAKPESRIVGSEVSRLGWSIDSRTGIAGRAIVRRIEKVLRRRLARLGWDLDDPAQHAAIDEVLSAGVREVFQRTVIRRDDLENVLAALDRLPERMEQR